MTERIEFPAHINSCDEIQSVAEHNCNVAAYAAQYLKDAALAEIGWICGSLHDIGKMKKAFADYLRASHATPGSVKRGSVNHTFSGVKFVLGNFHTETFESLTAELLAYAIGAHHGLFDCIDENHRSGFDHRLYKDGIDHSEVMANVSNMHVDISKAIAEIKAVFPRIIEISSNDDECAFYFGLLARTVLSALIDADRRDTAEFMTGVHYPAFADDMRILWTERLGKVERKLDGFETKNDIQKVRRLISERCRVFAENPPGVYRLNVPTGGGKTLSGLRYALAHAAKWNKKRIVFTSPLLSILEQNAKVIRDAIGNDDIILEHHSNIINDDGENDFLTETWSAPVIITTFVQLLNTMFDGKTGSIRRFHSLINSVIVVDEIQTLPPKLITMFNLCVNYLVSVCGATIILSSATHPCFEKVEHPIRYGEVKEIIELSPEILEIFKRTEIRNAGSFALEDMPDFVRIQLLDVNSALVVCNRKDEAEYLFQSFGESGVLCFHLSAAMCTQHRRDVLNRIKSALKFGKKVLCISTQVIEAGVDISFEKVIRFAAGMDSVIQAAGRCNRNGESQTPGTVLIVNCTNEKLAKLPEIDSGKTATISLLSDFEKTPERYACDIASCEAINAYYKRYFSEIIASNVGRMDFPVKGKRYSLFDLLSQNTAFYTEEDNYILHQAFKTAGSLFSVFDDNTTDVITMYGDGRKFAEALIVLDGAYTKDYSAIHAAVNSAKPYTIALQKYQMDKLERCGGVLSLFDGSISVLLDGFYDENTGFSINNQNSFQCI